MQICSGTVIFGKAQIRVGFHPTGLRDRSVHFGRFHRMCGKKLTHRLSCPQHGLITDRDDAARQWEYAPGKWVSISESEIEELEQEGTGEIRIEEFAPIHTQDPNQFASFSYWLAPIEGSKYHYLILREALESTNLSAGGVYEARGKSCAVSLVASNGCLLLREMYRDHELRTPPPVTKEKLHDHDREQARQIIDHKLRQAPRFDYPNRQQEALDRLARKKALITAGL